MSEPPTGEKIEKTLHEDIAEQEEMIRKDLPSKMLFYDELLHLSKIATEIEKSFYVNGLRMEGLPDPARTEKAFNELVALLDGSFWTEFVKLWKMLMPFYEQLIPLWADKAYDAYASGQRLILGVYSYTYKHDGELGGFDCGREVIGDPGLVDDVWVVPFLEDLSRFCEEGIKLLEKEQEVREHIKQKVLQRMNDGIGETETTPSQPSNAPITVFHRLKDWQIHFYNQLARLLCLAKKLSGAFCVITGKAEDIQAAHTAFKELDELLRESFWGEVCGKHADKTWIEVYGENLTEEEIAMIISANMAYHYAKEIVNSISSYLALHGEIGGFNCGHCTIEHDKPETYYGSYIFHLESNCNGAIESAQKIPIVLEHIRSIAISKLDDVVDQGPTPSEDQTLTRMTEDRELETASKETSKDGDDIAQYNEKLKREIERHDKLITEKGLAEKWCKNCCEYYFIHLDDYDCDPYSHEAYQTEGSLIEKRNDLTPNEVRNVNRVLVSYYEKDKIGLTFHCGIIDSMAAHLKLVYKQQELKLKPDPSSFYTSDAERYSWLLEAQLVIRQIILDRESKRQELSAWNDVVSQSTEATPEPAPTEPASPESDEATIEEAVSVLETEENQADDTGHNEELAAIAAKIKICKGKLNAEQIAEMYLEAKRFTIDDEAYNNQGKPKRNHFWYLLKQKGCGPANIRDIWNGLVRELGADLGSTETVDTSSTGRTNIAECIKRHEKKLKEKALVS